MTGYNLYEVFHTFSQLNQNGGTLIDNIFTNVLPDEYSAYTVNIHISDNFAQILDIESKRSAETNKIKLTRSMSTQNINSFRDKSKFLEWTNLYNIRENAEFTYNTFNTMVMNEFENDFLLIQ